MEAKDRQVLSIESQVNEPKTLAEKLNHPSIEVLTEAQSAKEPGRPVFNRMMQRIYRGEAQGILCWKLDRLARTPVDGGSIIWALKQHGIKILTPTQTYSHDEDNTILMYIEFGMAQKYIDDLSRNVKRGLKTKMENGWYPGMAPLGYLNDTAKNKGAKDVLKEPDRFPFSHYTYYHCTKSRAIPCSQGNIEANTLDGQIDAHLARVEISERFRDWALKYLHEVHEQEVKGRHTILQSQQRIYQDCLKRLDHLVKLKTAPQNADGGLLSDEENGRQHMELLKEKARLEELFQNTGHRVAQWLELSEKTFAFACSARQWFATGDAETKKAILTAVGSNLTLKDKTLGIEAKKPFAILETSLPGLPEAKPTFEPKKFRVDKAQSAAFGDGLRSYLCRKDDDRTCRWTQEEKKVVQRIWHHAQTCLDEGPALLGMLRHLATPPPVGSFMRSTSVRRGHQS